MCIYFETHKILAQWNYKTLTMNCDCFILPLKYLHIHNGKNPHKLSINLLKNSPIVVRSGFLTPTHCFSSASEVNHSTLSFHSVKLYFQFRLRCRRHSTYSSNSTTTATSIHQHRSRSRILRHLRFVSSGDWDSFEPLPPDPKTTTNQRQVIVFAWLIQPAARQRGAHYRACELSVKGFSPQSTQAHRFHAFQL